MATQPYADTADTPPAEGKARPDYTPDGYKDADEFLTEARELYRMDREADRENLDAALDDLKFASGDQWDKEVLAIREGLKQPSVTNNTLPQFIGQVVGDRRVNSTSVKVLPREDSDVDIAEIRSDLIRNIETQSRAERVYSLAFEHEVTCGIGNFRVELDWTDDDVFDRDIFVRGIANPLAVTWDAMSIDPTGRDADHCFVDDLMPRKLYEKLYPDTPATTIGGDLASDCMAEGWLDQDVVRVTEYWRMTTRKRTIALMLDGKVLDITDKQWDEYAGQLFRDEMGQPRTRQVNCKYAQMHLITGFAILKPAYELKINRLPVIRCNGREVPVGDKRVRFGLVRFIKDNQRQANFWDSVKTEILSKAPRQQWFGPADAFEGYRDKFRQAHLTGDPIIEYNPKASAAPQQMEPVQYPAAFATESALQKQYMKDGSGLHDASLGIKSNETSGIAIQRRQHEGDIATVIYHDNMNAAVQEAGDVINQLIPQVYDVARTIRVVGADQEERLQRINDPSNPDSVDLAKGKYDVTITTGPAYQTRRQEASQSMVEFARTLPELTAVAADLFAKAQDWPGGDEIAERFRKAMIKAGTIEDDNEEGEGAEQGGEPNPEQMAAMQQQQQAMQMQQMAAQAQQATMQAEVTKAMAEARQAEANAVKAEADAQRAQIEAQRAEVEMTAGIGRTSNEFSDTGQPGPVNNPQSGTASQKRNSGRQRRNDRRQ